MKQFVKLEIDDPVRGDQLIEGEVLQWCQTVASFSGHHLQVPAVTVRRGGEVLTVPLQAQHAHTKISIWDEA